MGKVKQLNQVPPPKFSISKISSLVAADPEVISNPFTTFYASLYTPNQDLNILELDEFLEIPSIEEVTDCLIQPVSEVCTAVKSIQSSNSPALLLSFTRIYT